MVLLVVLVDQKLVNGLVAFDACDISLLQYKANQEFSNGETLNVLTITLRVYGTNPERVLHVKAEGFGETKEEIAKAMMGVFHV